MSLDIVKSWRTFPQCSQGRFVKPSLDLICLRSIRGRTFCFSTRKVMASQIFAQESRWTWTEMRNQGHEGLHKSLELRRNSIGDWIKNQMRLSSLTPIQVRVPSEKELKTIHWSSFTYFHFFSECQHRGKSSERALFLPRSIFFWRKKQWRKFLVLWNLLFKCDPEAQFCRIS